MVEAADGAPMAALEDAAPMAALMAGVGALAQGAPVMDAAALRADAKASAGRVGAKQVSSGEKVRGLVRVRGIW